MPSGDWDHHSFFSSNKSGNFCLQRGAGIHAPCSLTKHQCCLHILTPGGICVPQLWVFDLSFLGRLWGEEMQEFLKDESSASLSMSILGTCLKWGEIKSFPKNSSVRRGILDALGRQPGLPFLRWPRAASPLTSVHKSWADPGTGMCSGTDTSLLTWLWGYSAPLSPLTGKMDCTDTWLQTKSVTGFNY